MNRIVARFDTDRLRKTAPTVAIAALAGFAGTVGSYALAGTTPGFVAAPISGFLARTLPGFVLTLAITLLGSLGQQLNLLTAIGLATAGFAVVAGAGTPQKRPMHGGREDGSRPSPSPGFVRRPAATPGRRPRRQLVNQPSTERPVWNGVFVETSAR